MDSYQRFARSPEFRPRSVGSSTESLRRIQNQQEADLRRFAGQFEQRNQNLIQDSRLVGQDLKDLSKFSKTALDVLETNIKQTVKDKEIGAQFDALTEGIEGIPEAEATAEAEIIAQGEVENKLLSGPISKANQIDPTEGERLRPGRRIGEGLTDEKVLLKEAKNAYPGFLSQFAASDTLIDYNGRKVAAFTLLQLDPAAVYAAGRREFIKSRNLQYTTKTNFVGILGDTIRSTEGYLTTNAVQQNIRKQREDTKTTYSGAIRNDSENLSLAATNLENISSLFQDNASALYSANTGLTMTGANALTVELMTKGFVAAGNYQAVALLKGVQQIEGKENTELGRIYGDVIDNAVFEAEAVVDKRQVSVVNRLEERMMQQLEQEDLSQEERLTIVQNAAEQMRRYGSAGFNRAEKILGNSNTLVLQNDSKVNDAQLDLLIEQGNPPDLAQIKAGQLAGKYSPEAYKRAEKYFQQKEKESIPEVKLVAKSIEKTFVDNSLKLLGIKKDQLGNLNYLNKTVPWVTDEQIAAFESSFRVDFENQKDFILRGIDSTDPREIAAELDRQLNAWLKVNTSPGGKYYVGGFFEDEDRARAGKEHDYGPFWSQFDKPDFRNSDTVQPKPRNLQSSVIPGGVLPVAVNYNYNDRRGDTLFRSDQVLAFKSDWEQYGVNPELEALSNDLNISPLKLLNEQLVARGEEPYTPPAPKEVKFASTNIKFGVTAFEKVGFPKTAAVYLAATVAEVTGWEDGDSLKIETWAEEMRLRDPVAFETLMRPNESRRRINGAITRLFGEIPNVAIYANYLLT